MIFFFQLWKVKTLHEARIFLKYTLIRTNASFMWIKMKMNKSVLQRGGRARHFILLMPCNHWYFSVAQTQKNRYNN